jgi:UV DNA damage endonuclease
MTAYPVKEFYRLTENALAKETIPGSAENAALNVWVYFKDKATEKERAQFRGNLENYRNSTGSLATVKRQLLKLAEKS